MEGEVLTQALSFKAKLCMNRNHHPQQKTTCVMLECLFCLLSKCAMAFHSMTCRYTCRTRSSASYLMPMTSLTWDRPRLLCNSSVRTGCCGRNSATFTLQTNR